MGFAGCTICLFCWVGLVADSLVSKQRVECALALALALPLTLTSVCERERKRGTTTARGRVGTAAGLLVWESLTWLGVPVKGDHGRCCGRTKGKPPLNPILNL